MTPCSCSKEKGTNLRHKPRAVLENYMSLAALTSTMLCLKYNQLGAEESDSNYIVF